MERRGQSSKLSLVLSALVVIDLVLVLAVALRYSYSPLTAAEASAGLIILLGAGGWVRMSSRRSRQLQASPLVRRAVVVGLALGALWVIEISINNFIAPPLPARDIVDNLFWAAIALGIFGLALNEAYQADSLARGIESGVWSGFASGLLACTMALSIILFAMRFITRDPLNVAEWAARGATANAPGMAAYFAFETFAGAFLHLVVLGAVMGGLLGVVAGSLGKLLRAALRLVHRA